MATCANGRDEMQELVYLDKRHPDTSKSNSARKISKLMKHERALMIDD